MTQSLSFIEYKFKVYFHNENPRAFEVPAYLVKSIGKTSDCNSFNGKFFNIATTNNMFGSLTDQRILKKIQAYHQIDGWLTDPEAIGLYRTARRVRRNATVVEIGSWQGKSTYCISKGLRSGRVYAIDPFNADAGSDTDSQAVYLEKGRLDLLETFENNMERLGVAQKVVPKKGYSQDFAHAFTQIDFLFIDGDHSIEGCQSDFDLYAPKIVPGGLIAFHDYYEHRNTLGPTYVIQHRVLPSGQYQFVNLYDSLWVAAKI